MKAKETSKGNIKLVFTKEEAEFLREFIGNVSSPIIEDIIQRQLTDEELREDILLQVYEALKFYLQKY